MNLKSISDAKLLQKTKALAQQVRSSMTALLHHLKEIDSRRLYSSLKYGSINEYTMKELKCSEDEACRRVSAMRMLTEFPQLEEKISSGALSMTNLNMARQMFRREKKARRELSKAAKLDLLSKLENKSTREAGKELAKIAPIKICDRVRYVSEDEIELKTAITAETLRKLERLKGLLAHSCPDMTFGELIDKLADEGLKTLDKAQIAAPRFRKEKTGPKKSAKESIDRLLKKSTKEPCKEAGKEACKEPSKKSAEELANQPPKHSSKPSTSRYIPAAVNRYVWKRDKCCQVCGSDYALQVDHVVPVAMGGVSVVENLRLLCRHCNQRAAIEMFGLDKMREHLEELDRH